MTPERLKQWNAFACMSRCLIKAAELNNIQITADEYRSRYESMFPNQAEQYGGLFLSTFFEIASRIGLGGNMDLCFEYAKVDSTFNKDKVLTFVFSGINLNSGCSDCINHTSILRAMDCASFSLWTPSNDGTDHDHLPFKATDWVAKRCCAITVF